MRLYLMRHGLAIDRDDPECPPEAERYLLPKGIERTRDVARALGHLGAKPAVLLTSPYVRAVQTGEAFCKELELDEKALNATEALKPEAKATKLAEELGKLSAEEVICFGHAPHLDDFIAHVVRASGPITELKKSGVACLEMQTFSPAGGLVKWILTPKMVRTLRD
jgi:phosphohistidine phosphatase